MPYPLLQGFSLLGGIVREAEIDRRQVGEKRRAAAASVLAGLVLTVLKLAAGLATGSLGLLAEAAHSALDLGAAGLTWLAVRTSWRPPDADHLYGHGKIENLAALAETALLALTSVWIFYEAGSRILGEGTEVEPSVWAFLVMAISIGVDVRRSRDLKRVAKATGSQALEADALHFSTDIASSAVVIVGLLGVLLSRREGWAWAAMADPAAACVVAGIVLVLSWRLGRRAVDVLMDRAPAGVERRVRIALADLEGLRDEPGIRARKGGDRVFVDVELRLRPGVPLAEGERIAAQARERIGRSIGKECSVLVQLGAAPDESESLRDRVATAVAMAGHQAHDITVREDAGGAHADLHLELAGSLSLSRAHDIANRVEARILREIPVLRRVDIHLELHDEEPEQARPLEESVRREIEARVRETVGEIAGEGAVHDLMLTRTSTGIYLSCHCFIPGDTSLSDAHELTDRLEEELQRAVPELVRVSVHAEPR